MKAAVMPDEQPAPGSSALRKAFGRFATGVVVVTAPKPDGAWAAVTVNSFTSVSLSPPLVLWCLGLNANCRAHFESADTFTVNVLRHDQQALSSRLARPSACNWRDVPVRRSSRGQGLIDGALATFECSVHSRFEAGDHLVFVGRIDDFACGPAASPLAFFQGTYGSFTADQGGGPHEPSTYVTDAELTLGWG